MEDGARHAQVNDEAASIGEAKQEVLAPARNILDAPPRQTAAELGRRRPLDDTLRPRQYADVAERSTHRSRLEIAAYRFHFG
jgi:hypothetical protein